MAAAFLLRYRTADAQKVLSEVASHKGLIAFSASESLMRWQEGTWAFVVVISRNGARLLQIDVASQFTLERPYVTPFHS